MFFILKSFKARKLRVKKLRFMNKLIRNGLRVRVIVLGIPFNSISVGISEQSVLLVEETGENHRPAANHRQTLSHNVVSSKNPFGKKRFKK